MKTKIMIVLLCSSLSCIAVNRQKMVIWAKDGSKVSYNLQACPKITFMDENLVVKVNGIVRKYDLNETAFFNYISLLMGDVNKDGLVNESDIESMVNDILGKRSNSFVWDAADMNDDNKVNVSDVILLLKTIIGQEEHIDYTTTDSIATSICLSMEDVKMTVGTQRNMNVTLTQDSVKFVGFQFDVVFPVGITLDSISVKEEKTGDMVLSKQVQDDGTIRLIGYYPSFAIVNEGNIMELQLRADKRAEAGTYNLKITNIVMTDAEGNTIRADELTAKVTIVPPVTVTAKNVERTYGDENGILAYDISDSEINGTPTISCEATVTSPVGNYDIVVGKGTLAADSVILVNGTLTITKAPLKVTVKDVVREQGEENPKFEIIYEGWKQQDTESVLIKKPVATTTATQNSPVGEYEIAVDGGEAQNYELSYVKGKLTVTVPSEIGELLMSGRPFDVYIPSGLKVRHQVTTLEGLPKGVYIVEGKKVVVK